MGKIEYVPDPAPNGYVECPYEDELKAALEYVRRETDSTEGWTNIGE